MVSGSLFRAEEAFHLREKSTVVDSRGKKRLSELRRESNHVGVPVSRLLREPAHDYCFNLWPELKVRPRLVESDWWLRQELREHFTRRLGEIWKATGQQKVRDRGEAILISSRRYELAAERLRCNVHQRPNEKPCAGQALIGGSISGSGNSEIEKL